MARTRTSLLAPSDLSQHPDGSVRVAGRWRRTPAGRQVIADALGSVEVDGAADVEAEEGDLVEVEANLAAGRLSRPCLLACHRPERPPARMGATAPSNETSRLADDGVGARLRLRASVLRTVRRFFESEGFLEVDTPAVVPSPGLDLHLDAFTIAERIQGREAFLETSPEYQMKRLLTGGLPRIFQLARAFRRDEAGAQHNPEFLLLEWYRAFADMEQVVRDTERLVREVIDSHAASLRVQGPGGAVDFEPPFLRWTVKHAFAELAPDVGDPIALVENDDEQFFRHWVEQIEPGLAALPRPVFVLDFPVRLASLARAKPTDPRLCERFELYAGGVELCNGFGELVDPTEQRQRLERDQQDRARTGRPVYPIDERFLAALQEGMPPSAGNALGLDRLVALCAGTTTIADVQPFPLDWW